MVMPCWCRIWWVEWDSISWWTSSGTNHLGWWKRQALIHVTCVLSINLWLFHRIVFIIVTIQQHRNDSSCWHGCVSCEKYSSHRKLLGPRHWITISPWCIGCSFTALSDFTWLRYTVVLNLSSEGAACNEVFKQSWFAPFLDAEGICRFSPRS